jgi:diamine N-acetyltransferase
MGTSRITIRGTTPDDAALLSAIGSASFRAAYAGTADEADLEKHLQDHFSAVAIRGELEDAQCRYLLGLIDRQAAGYVKIRERGHTAVAAAAQPLEVQQVYVAPDRQRQGLAGELIEAAAFAAVERGCDGLWLSVWEHAPWAINCYRKYGFEVVGSTDFVLGRSVFNDFLMWRPL